MATLDLQVWLGECNCVFLRNDIGLHVTVPNDIHLGSIEEAVPRVFAHTPGLSKPITYIYICICTYTRVFIYIYRYSGLKIEINVYIYIYVCTHAQSPHHALC